MNDRRLAPRRVRQLALAFALLLTAALPAPASAEPSTRVDVLIQFVSAPTAADVRLVQAAGGTVTRQFAIVPAVAATLPTAAIDALRRNPRVALIEPDSLVYAMEYGTGTRDWGIGHINADDVHRASTPNRGAGVTIAVLDSGIDCEHVELQGRCDYGQSIGENFVADPSYEAVNEADDDYGHGTHVSGTIAAALNATTDGVVGVAPDATVVALKTLDSSGSGAWSRHIAAIEHVWNNGAPLVDIVNMSIGRGDYSSTAELAMQKAYDSGILLVAAAGNSGQCSGRGNNLAYPALFPSVIAVAAVDSTNARPCWSSTGDKVELTAPGVSVFSTWPADMSTSYRDPQPVCESSVCYYKYGSGTSMSSPHVAGAAALLVASGYVDGLTATVRSDALRQRLAATALDLGTSGRDPQFGYGLVDAAASVALTATDPGDGDGGGGSAFDLTATGYKVKGIQHADLSWSGTTANAVDVYRDGSRIAASIPNDGAHTDNIGKKGGGTYTYKICDAGTTTCSNEVSVSF